MRTAAAHDAETASGVDPVGMRAAAAVGVIWVSLDSWGRQLLTFAVFVTLARLLDKHDFGLVSLASIQIGFMQMIVTQGLGTALIQRRMLTSADLDAAFWMSFGTALVLGLVTATFREPIAGMLGDVGAADVLAVLTVLPVIAAVSVVPSAILTREMRFKVITMRSAVAAVSGAVVGVTAALSHAGVWSLVAQQVVTVGTAGLLLWTCVSWRPGLRATRGEFVGLAVFAVGVMGNDVLWFVSQRIDHAVIGRTLGAEALAEYTVAVRVLTLCIEGVAAPASHVALPVFSKIHRDQGSLAQVYMRSSVLISAVGIPAFTGLALVAPRLVPLAFGMKWQGVVLPLQILCVSGIIRVAQTFVHPTFMALGRPGVYTLIFALLAATSTAGALVVAGRGIAAVACAITVAYAITGVVNVTVVGRYVGVSLWATARPVVPIVAACLPLVLVVVGTDHVLSSHLNDVGMLVAQCLAGAVAYAATLNVVAPAVMRDLLGFAGVLRAKWIKDSAMGAERI